MKEFSTHIATLDHKHKLFKKAEISSLWASVQKDPSHFLTQQRLFKLEAYLNDVEVILARQAHLSALLIESLIGMHALSDSLLCFNLVLLPITFRQYSIPMVSYTWTCLIF
jgi:hypothetical protein